MDIALIRLKAGWEEAFRSIRLHSLQHDPRSFANTLAQEKDWPLSRTSDLLAYSQVWGCVTLDNRLVGTLALTPYDPLTMKHKARMHAVYVHPDYRGRGLSKRLIAQALAETRPLFSIITLAVDASNQSAIRLYESFGFKQFGYEKGARRYGHDVADDVWMIRHQEEDI